MRLQNKIWHKSIIALVVLTTMLLLWNRITATVVYIFFIDVYTQVSLFLISVFASISDVQLTYGMSGSIFNSYNERFYLVMPTSFFPVITFLLILLFIFYGINLKNVLISLCVILFFMIRSVLITWLNIRYQNSSLYVLMDVIDPLRYLPFYVLLLYIFNTDKYLKKFLQNLNEQLNKTLLLKVEIIVGLMLFASPLPRAILTMIDVSSLNFLVRMTLKISEMTFGWLNIDSYVSNNTLIVKRNWIYLGHGCLGLGLFTILFILIAVSKGNIIAKSIYLLALLPVFILINSLRVDLLMWYFLKKWYMYIKPDQMHDIGNLFIYLSGFILFLIYFLWFQHKFDNAKNEDAIERAFK